MHGRIWFLVGTAVWLSGAFCLSGRAAAPSDPAVRGADAFYAINGSLRGILLPMEDVRISSRGAGVIHRYLLEEGQIVQKGDALLELNSEEERAEISRAEAARAGAAAELAHAREEFARVEGLAKDGVSSQKQYQEAHFAVEAAQSRLQEREAGLEVARNRLEERLVRSPIDGIFFKKLKSIGESVERFEVVARVVDLSLLQMVVYCDAHLLGRSKVGDLRQIELLEGPFAGAKVSAKVAYVDSLLDPATGTFRVKLILEPSEKTIAGISARLLLPGETSTAQDATGP
ncbi:MAG: efflux RND transporter periplasmic adaptor subunit [Methylacidiphilaceae bacterium]|nr:efflux RND transporter periplasmic adaptor subunit [Candidatus Methylacidiphilaceae bacterium]